jgi:hypothetical protein
VKGGLTAFTFLSFGVIVAMAGNLVQNPGFEEESNEDPDDHGDSWGSASRENWRARTGEFIAAVRGTWAGAGDYGGWWQEAEAESGITYQAAAWFWADATWSAGVQEIKIEFWNSDRSQLLGVHAQPLGNIGEEWTQRSVEGAAPEHTVWVRVVINVSDTGAEGALQIDDVELTAVP